MSNDITKKYFEIDPMSIDISIVKSICLDPTIRALQVQINDYSIIQTIYLYQFSKSTIEPLKKQLREALHSITSKNSKQKIINSVISCINQNIDTIKEYLPNIGKNNNGEDNEKESTSSSNANILVDLAADHKNAELFFKDQYGKPFVAVRLGIDRHLEIIPLESKKYMQYAARLFRDNMNGKIISTDSISNAINILAANAEFDGEIIPLHLRVAWGDTVKRCKPGSLYYDMTDTQWRMIEISKNGPKIITGSDNEVPILFRRRNQTAQVEPDWNYPPDIFDRFLDLTNVKTKHRQLIKVYIISLLIPEIAHVILTIHGPQGAAKSFFLRLIKKLIDPSKPELLSLHKDIREFMHQVSHNYLSFYDNIKFISQELSDEICKAVTGIGSTKRELYTDDEDFIYEYKHCLSINGINVALTESDALGRSLLIELDEISDEKRRKEEDVLAEFEKLRRKLLAYIFDTISNAMKIKDSLHLPKLTRMADFTEWGEAISRAMEYERMSFVNALYSNRKEQNIVAIEESLVGSLLVRFWKEYRFDMIEKGSMIKFEGSPAELYNQLVIFAENNEININNRYFPKTPNILVKKINIIKPNLKHVYGIIVNVDRDSSNNSIITIHDSVNYYTTNNSARTNLMYDLQVLQRHISSLTNHV